MEKIGKYSLLGEIGRGGMGVVYRGLDPYIGRPVAIKTVRFEPGQHESARESLQRRFLREAQSAGNLAHPHIITIYDVGEADGLTYIAMEYVEGGSLEEELRRRRFEPAEAAELLRQVADALDYAHSRGVVHRDIKPANILLDRAGRAHIVDFGIAHMHASTMTQTGVLMGTPRYMSPEQVAGRRVDSRSDLFSLAAVAYELLTGRPPFDGADITAIIYQIVHGEAADPRSLNPELPATAAGVLQKALAKDPAARHATCREFAGELLAACAAGPSPALAAAAAPFDRHHHRLLLATGGAIVLLAALLLLVLPGRRRPAAPRTPVVAGPVSGDARPTRLLAGPSGLGGELSVRRDTRTGAAGGEGLLLPSPPALAPGGGIVPQGAAADTDLVAAARRLHVDRVLRNDHGAVEAEVANHTVLVLVPAATFRMGSTIGAADEAPPHAVTLTAYWLGKTEVTFAQYDRFCMETGRALADDAGMGRGEHPALNVSWHDAVAYCTWLARKTGLPVRLPSEAEWERAAVYKYPWGQTEPDRRRGNLRGGEDGFAGTAPVGSFPRGASPFGLLDMAGNVWEWTADWYDPGYYGRSPARDPRGLVGGSQRAVRGGSWKNGADLVRSANRSQEKPASCLDVLGFRVAMEDPPRG